MAYCILFDDTEHTLRIELTGVMTSQELRDLHTICAYYLDETEKPIRIIVDARWLQDFPMHMRQNVRYSEYFASPLLKDVVLLGDNNAINFFFILLSQMYQFELILAMPAENQLRDAS